MPYSRLVHAGRADPGEAGLRSSAAMSSGTKGAVLDLWSLRVFLEVAETRSMTTGAANLGLTQSAVSHTIRKMEGEFGVALMERGRRPLSLTAAGRLLERRAAPLLREAASIPDQVRQAAGAPVREFRLGFVDTFAATAAPDLVSELTKSATNVVVWSGLAPSLSDALIAGTMDAIVTSDPLDDVDGLRRYPLWRELFMVLLPKDRRWPGQVASFQDLASELPFVRFSSRSHTGMQIERHLRRVGCVPPRRIEVDGSEALMGMVAAGVGWAIATPLCLLQGALHLPRVQVADCPRPRFSRRLTLVCRDDAPPGLIEQTAGAARRVLRESCLSRLAELLPDVARQIVVGEGDGG